MFLYAILKTYNERKHRSIGMSPNQGEDPSNHEHIRAMHESYYESIKPTKRIRFKLGDVVKIVKLEAKFGRGYDKKAPEELFKISNIIRKFPRVLYEIVSLDNQEIIGRFYQEQLVKAAEPESYIVEKILKLM